MAHCEFKRNRSLLRLKQNCVSILTVVWHLWHSEALKSPFNLGRKSVKKKAFLTAAILNKRKI